ncbi:fatty-acyl-CoA synthase [Burkholderiales bacterium]|nr:fatty-acyl-CoA synthase [Burkholderiales bacterium]
MTFNITDGIRSTARLHPGAIAIVCGLPGAGAAGARTIDYASLDRILDAIAARVIEQGLSAGASVDIPTRQALPLLLIKLAMARAGISTFQGERTTGADMALVKPGQPARTSARAIAFDPSWWSEEAISRAPAGVIPHAGGATVYSLFRTSGSTGLPKEVLVTHDMMRARWWGDLPDGLPHRARFLCPSGPGGGVGMGYALRVFGGAGTVVVPQGNDDLAALVDAHRVSAFVGSPSSVARLLRGRAEDAGPFASLEVVLITGARLPAALAHAARARACANLVCFYGATEVGPVAFGSLAAMGDHPGAAGFVLPGVDVEATDDAGRTLPPGQPGLLRMRSPGMGHAYVDDPAATARHFRDGWFVPGDIGAVDGDGMLSIQGRNDDLINLGGSKFAPEAIEELLLGVPGVFDAAAFPIHHANGNTGVGAAIVASEDVGVPALEAPFHHSHLPKPYVVIRVDRLPRTESGKVIRRELTALAMARMPGAARRPAS